MFDGKVGEVDDTEREFQAIAATMRDWAESAVASAGQAPVPDIPPAWRRALSAVGEFGTLVLALAVTAGLLFGAAAVARLGWTLAGT